MIDTEPFKKTLVGKKVSHVWRGHGSAIFLEFGKLNSRTRKDGSVGNPDGELTFMIDWSWRIEKPKSILGGSWSSEKKIDNILKKLEGATVDAVEFFGRLPEISVSLSNGLHVVSFNTSEGQPDWSLLTRSPFIGHLCVERGVLKIDNRDS